jgi:hypothetical protein
MEEHFNGAKRNDVERREHLSSILKDPRSFQEDFYERIKDQAIQDYLKDVPAEKVTNFWDPISIENNTNQFNKIIDDINKMCNDYTKKHNDLTIKKSKRFLINPLDQGTSISVLNFEKEGEDIVNKKFSELYNSQYGKLMFSSQFASHVGSFAPNDCIDGRWGGISTAQLNKIPVNPIERNVLLKKATDEFLAAQKNHKQGLLNDRAYFVAKRSTPETHKKSLKEYLISNPIAFQEFLNQNNLSSEDYLYVCSVASEILKDDKNNQTINTVGNGVVMAAGGLLLLSGLGSGVGAGLIAVISNAGTAGVLIANTHSYMEASKEISRSSSGGVSGNLSKTDALKNINTAVDEQRTAKINTVVELAGIAAGAAIGGSEDVNNFFKGLSTEQNNSLSLFKRSIKFEDFRAEEQAELMKLIYDTHIDYIKTNLNNKHRGAKRTVTDVHKYLIQNLRIDPKLASDQIDKLSNEKILNTKK